jgi:hypothetical protein
MFSRNVASIDEFSSVNVKSNMENVSIFVAFLENMNFIG